MHTKGIRYDFKAVPWRYEGTAGWVFVSLPAELSVEIRELLKEEEQGWGRLSATAKIGGTEWQTAIWFDTKKGTYLLPLKAEIRKKEQVAPGSELSVVLWI